MVGGVRERKAVVGFVVTAEPSGGGRVPLGGTPSCGAICERMAHPPVRVRTVYVVHVLDEIPYSYTVLTERTKVCFVTLTDRVN